MEPLYIGNDQEISISGYKDAGGTALVAATVEANLYDWEGGLVEGPLTLSHTGNGDYSAVLDGSVTAGFSKGAYYKIVITAQEGEYDNQWDIEMITVYRNS